MDYVPQLYGYNTNIFRIVYIRIFHPYFSSSSRRFVASLHERGECGNTTNDTEMYKIFNVHYKAT